VNPLLRDRILRALDRMNDERAYEVLDYIEFLESKYAVRPSLATAFQRFAVGVEDTLRAGRLPVSAVAETMTLLDRAVGVLSGVAAASKSVASDLVQGAASSSEREGSVSKVPGAPSQSGPGAEAASDSRSTETR